MRFVLAAPCQCSAIPSFGQKRSVSGYVMAQVGQIFNALKTLLAEVFVWEKREGREADLKTHICVVSHRLYDRRFGSRGSMEVTLLCSSRDGVLILSSMSLIPRLNSR